MELDVALLRQRDNKPLSKRARTLIELSHGVRTTGEIARAICTDQCSAFSQLTRLEAEGLVQRSKSGRKGSGRTQRKWRLVPWLSTPCGKPVETTESAASKTSQAA